MTTNTATNAMTEVKAPQASNELRRMFRVLFKRKIVVASFVVLLLALFLAIFADWIAPYDPNYQDLARGLQSPLQEHWLGTDELGRDVLSRIIHGTRISLFIGVVSVILAFVTGSLLGLISGYYGGFFDALLSRMIDALLSFPNIVLALGVGAALGSGPFTIIVALTLAFIPTFARVMRGQVLSIKENDYIKAAKVIGASQWRIIIKHIFPNCVSPMIVLITLNMGVAILAEATLSFLGVGVSPDIPTWGAMVNEGYRFLVTHPILSFAPGACVLIIVLAFNIVGDGLRDALDPRLRGSI